MEPAFCQYDHSKCLNPCYNGMTMECTTSTEVNFSTCLNPCYNGMTMESKTDAIHDVYDGLNPCYNGMTMEYDDFYLSDEEMSCLNPCYNGMTMEFVVMFMAIAAVAVLILVIME